MHAMYVLLRHVCLHAMYVPLRCNQALHLLLQPHHPHGCSQASLDCGDPSPCRNRCAGSLPLYALHTWLLLKWAHFDSPWC